MVHDDTSGDAARGKTSAADEPPGPRGLPVLGNTLSYVRGPHRFREQCVREYGDTVRVEILGNETFVLAHPDDIESVFYDNWASFKRSDIEQKWMTKVLGDGLLASEGEFWQRQRKLIQPGFSVEKIESYAEGWNDYVLEYIDDWQYGSEFDVVAEMKGLTLHILTKSLFGSEIDYERQRIDQAAAALVRPSRPSKQPIAVLVPDWVPIPLHREFSWALDHLHDIIDDLIEEKRAEGVGSLQRADHHDDLLSMLLAAEEDDGTSMSDKTVRDEIMSFLLAGHESTAFSLSFIWYLLARHPEVEQNLRAEFEEVLGQDSPTIETVQELTYTEKVIKEALRLYPVVHGLRRQATEDVEVGGYQLSEGSIVAMPQWVVHRDERWYDDPEAFRPERWTEDFERELPEFAYFPFGGGPHACIGKRFATFEMQYILANVLRDYSLELVSPRPEPLELSASVTLQPKETIRMRVEQRE